VDHRTAVTQSGERLIHEVLLWRTWAGQSTRKRGEIAAGD
jgi:hypothetical protein